MSTPQSPYPVEHMPAPQSATPPSMQPITAPPKQHKWLWTVGGLVVGAVVGILSTLAAAGAFTSSPTFVLSGTIAVSGGSDSVTTSSDGTTCEGAGGYSDITPGTAVTVANAQGQVVATGALGTGVMSSDDDLSACSLSFSVPGVPDGLSSYSLTISHRGTQVIPSAEAHSGVALTLGG